MGVGRACGSVGLGRQGLHPVLEEGSILKNKYSLLREDARAEEFYHDMKTTVGHNTRDRSVVLRCKVPLCIAPKL